MDRLEIFDTSAIHRSEDSGDCRALTTSRGRAAVPTVRGGRAIGAAICREANADNALFAHCRMPVHRLWVTIHSA